MACMKPFNMVCPNFGERGGTSLLLSLPNVELLMGYLPMSGALTSWVSDIGKMKQRQIG
jgi:hypothetical protein